MKIYRKSNNELIVKLIQDLWNNTNRYPSVFSSNAQYVQQSLGEYEEILSELKQYKNVEAE